MYKFYIINGVIKNIKNISPEILNDFGFLYGYGGFESLLIWRGKARYLKEHFERLNNLADFLKIQFLYDFENIKKEVEKLITINQVDFAKLNIYLLAGDKLQRKKNINFTNPKLILIIKKINRKLLKKPVKLKLQKEIFPRTKMDEYKTLNYAKNIFTIKSLAPDEDALFYDEQGKILETTVANIFFRQGNKIVTPCANKILPGIIRAKVIKTAKKLGFILEERDVFLNELKKFDEIFLTNSLKGILRRISL